MKLNSKQAGALLRAYKAKPQSIPIHMHTGNALARKGLVDKVDGLVPRCRINHAGIAWIEAKDYA